MRKRWHNLVPYAIDDDIISSGSGSGSFAYISPGSVVPAYKAPYTPEPYSPTVIQKIIDVVADVIAPAVNTTVQPLSKDYEYKTDVQFIPVEPLYVPQPAPMVIERDIIPLPPVDPPRVTYTDPVINTTVLPKPVINEDNPVPQPTVADKVDNVINKASDILDVITGKSDPVPAPQRDINIIYIAIAVGAIGVLALIFKK